MDRRSIPSRHLVSVGYDRLRKVMEVEFKNGRIYQYENVSEDIPKNLLASPSAGGYFNTVVRDAFQGKEISNG